MNLGPIGSPWFLFLAGAILAAVGWSLRAGAPRGIPRLVVIDVGIMALIGGVVGGRVHHALFEPLPADLLAPAEVQELLSASLTPAERAQLAPALAAGRVPAGWLFAAEMPPGPWREATTARLAVDPADVPVRWWYAARPGQLLAIWKGGFGFLGGLFLSSLLAILVIRRHGASVAQVADLAAPAVALGLAIGRLGCFVSGCCYGETCPPAWSVAPPWWEGGPPYDVPRWPTALLEGGWALLLFFVLRRASRASDAPPGQAFLLLLWLYAPGRFLLEALRGDPRGGLLGLSTSQWLVLLTGLPALVAWGVRAARGPARPPAQPLHGPISTR